MSRQGSASYTIVIGGVTAVVVGAIVLSFLAYPFINAFVGTPIFESSTTSGSRVMMYVKGFWTFLGGFVMIAIVIWIWITTRQ